MNSKIQTAERVSATDKSDNYVFQRSLLAYHEAAKRVQGDVLEIGTGSGYGVEVIAPHCRTYLTVDKKEPPIALTGFTNVEFRKMKVPPLDSIPTACMDFVVTFQVIEHIGDDFGFLREAHRVLREGGRLIVTTPNREMSLTRNPWHVREYDHDQLTNLLRSIFRSVEPFGVRGDEKVMEYYRRNKESVEKVFRLDPLRFRDILPRWLLKIPYDIMNRRNRRKLLEENTVLTSGITMDDYYLAPADDNCFDLFYIAKK